MRGAENSGGNVGRREKFREIRSDEFIAVDRASEESAFEFEQTGGRRKKERNGIRSAGGG